MYSSFTMFEVLILYQNFKLDTFCSYKIKTKQCYNISLCLNKIKYIGININTSKTPFLV